MKGYFRKRGEKWSFTVDIGHDPATGKRKQKTVNGFKTKKEAEKACAEIVTEYERGNLSTSSGLETVESFMKKYLETVLKNDIEAQTHEQKVANMNNYIIPELGRAKLQKLTPMQIQSFINNLIEKGLSAGTIQNIMRLVNQTLNKAVEWGYISRNVASFTSKPTYKPEKFEVWTKQQFEYFLQHSKNSRFFPFYLIGLMTGMRPGEIQALSWDQVDFKKKIIRVDRTAVWTKEKGIHIKLSPKNDSSIRNITVPDSVINYLKKLKMSQQPNALNLVVPGKKAPIAFNSVICQVMKKDIEASGLPQISPHDLRHTHATYLLSSPPFGLGQSIKAVSERLGHAKTTTTMNTYAHVLPNMQESLAEQIDQAISITL